MTRKLSPDAKDSLVLAFGVGGLFAVLLLVPHIWPDMDHPLWRNIYLWSSSADRADFGFFPVLVLITNGIDNQATGRPPRLWPMGLVFMGGLAAIVLTASFSTVVVPRVNLTGSLIDGGTGLTFGTFLLNGAVVQVGRNLVAPNIDYAGRLLPLAGTLLCAGMLVIWGMELEQRWSFHDYTVATTIACFALGILCALIGGKRRPLAPAGAEALG